MKCDALGVPARNKSLDEILSKPIVPVLEATSDSWIDIEFSTNERYVLLQMIWNLHEGVDQRFKSFFVHSLFGTTSSSKEVSIFLLQLCATESNKTNFHTKDWDSSFSFWVENRQKPVEGQISLIKISYMSIVYYVTCCARCFEVS